MSATPAPTDTYANKALVSALGTVVLVALRWAVSDEFQFSDEGLITLAGAVTTLAVYAVSNFRRVLGLRSEQGLTSVELIGLLCLGGIVLLIVLAV